MHKSFAIKTFIKQASIFGWILTTWGIGSCSCQDKKNMVSELLFEKLSIDSHETPSKRYDHSLAVDWQTKKVFLFGGRNGSEYQNDLWVFEADKRHWKKITASLAPSPRSGASLIFDPVGQRLILFGGFRDTEFGDSLFLRELWSYSEQEGWNQHLFSVGPEGRAWHAVGLGENNLVLFGGFTKAPEFHLNDIWSLQLDDMTFQRLATDGGPKMTGTPALLVSKDSKKVWIFGREGIPKPFRTGIWEVNVEEDRYTFLTESKNSPDADYMLALANPKLQSFLVIKQDPEDPNKKLLWLLKLPDFDFFRTTIEGGPSVSHGLGCSPYPISQNSWFCFGGVWRNQVHDESWVLRSSLLDRSN